MKKICLCIINERENKLELGSQSLTILGLQKKKKRFLHTKLHVSQQSHTGNAVTVGNKTPLCETRYIQHYFLLSNSDEFKEKSYIG